MGRIRKGGNVREEYIPAAPYKEGQPPPFFFHPSPSKHGHCCWGRTSSCHLSGCGPMSPLCPRPATRPCDTGPLMGSRRGQPAAWTLKQNFPLAAHP